MNVNLQGLHNMLFLQAAGGMKSTQQKMERQEKCENQVAFFEKQKEGLKDMKCGSLEEIARKLEMLHSYEDQIAAAKKEFNNSQMMHVLDEAIERGEKIAEAAEESAPKKAEEYWEDQAEEAAGTEEGEGMLTEMLEEVSEMTEELQEELQEQMSEELAEQVPEELQGQVPDDLQEQVSEGLQEGLQDKIAEGLTQQIPAGMQEQVLGERPVLGSDGLQVQSGTSQTRPAAVFYDFQEDREKQYRHIDYMI